MKKKRKNLFNAIGLVAIIFGVVLAFKGLSIEVNTGKTVEISREEEQESIPGDTVKEESIKGEPIKSTTDEKSSTDKDKSNKEEAGRDTPKDIDNAGSNTSKGGGSEKQYISMSISCTNLLNNMDSLKENKRPLVPSNGIMYSNNKIEFKEGDTVFDVLLRESRKNRLHMDFVETPMYNSAYIKGIGNIYEFDGGDLSGWMYSVSGEFPGFGCSQYKLKAGDNIQWKYTLDLGNDVRR